MRKVIIGAVAALLVLALSTMVVFGNTRSFGRASGSGQQENARTLSQEKDKPYIGIVVSTLGKAKTQELGIAGGAVVVRVLDNGSSAGVLKTEDIILSINGQQVTGAAAVIKIVGASKVGDVLTMQVRRGDSTITVEVKVGTRPTPQKPPQPGKKGMAPAANSLLRWIPMSLLQRMISAQIVVETDQGPKTIKVLAGTVASVDTTAKSITISPKDGSANVSFNLTDDTVLLNKGVKAGLDSVKAGDPARVASVDNKVELVLVGAVAPGLRMGPFPFPLNHGRSFQGGRGMGRKQATSIQAVEPGQGTQDTKGWLTS